MKIPQDSSSGIGDLGPAVVFPRQVTWEAFRHDRAFGLESDHHKCQAFRGFRWREGRVAAHCLVSILGTITCVLPPHPTSSPSIRMWFRVRACGDAASEVIATEITASDQGRRRCSSSCRGKLETTKMEGTSHHCRWGEMPRCVMRRGVEIHLQAAPVSTRLHHTVLICDTNRASPTSYGLLSYFLIPVLSVQRPRRQVLRVWRDAGTIPARLCPWHAGRVQCPAITPRGWRVPSTGCLLKFRFRPSASCATNDCSGLELTWKLADKVSC